MKLNQFIILQLCFWLAGAALAQRNNVSCGIIHGQPLTNAYGPFDFTKASDQNKLPIVLGAHFTPEVERLIRGRTGPIMGDIDYTLRAIPNYHRALYAMAKYQRSPRSKSSTSAFSHRFYTAECYFKRAIYFQPKDATSRMLYAMHLQQLNQYQAAFDLYQQALKLTPKAAELNYNYGLLLVKMKKYKLAKKAAAIAYKKGYPLPGLRNKLAQL